MLSVTENEFGRTNIRAHEIDTGDARPIKQPLRLVPLPMNQEVRIFVDNLEKYSLIQKSPSSWNNPVILVRNQDASLK